MLEDSGTKEIPKKILNKALHASVKGCNTERIHNTLQCIDYLIRYGAQVDSEAQQDGGKTALMIACRKGYIELVKEILEKEVILDTKDKDGRTALFHAIYPKVENIDVVRELLSRKCDVNIQEVKGLTPILVAAQNKHSTVVTELLANGA
jgi:ankyrin repeat protein